MSINKGPAMSLEPVKQHLEYTYISGYHILSLVKVNLHPVF